jgi:hypothetical protein
MAARNMTFRTWKYARRGPPVALHEKINGTILPTRETSNEDTSAGRNRRVSNNGVHWLSKKSIERCIGMRRSVAIRQNPFKSRGLLL